MAKIYALFDSSTGQLQGFYADDVWGARHLVKEEFIGTTISGEPRWQRTEAPNPDCRIPPEAVEIGTEDHQAFCREPDKWIWRDGARHPAPPSQGEELAAIQAAAVDTLWRAAHAYETDRINGSAVGMVTLGELRGLPKAQAVRAWVSGIWDLYYQRKALLLAEEPLTPEMLDYSICGDIPHSIPELREEVGM